jgi:hypothetical protein
MARLSNRTPMVEGTLRAPGRLTSPRRGLSDQLAIVIAALRAHFGTFDVEHVELAVDVAEDEIGSHGAASYSQ